VSRLTAAQERAALFQPRLRLRHALGWAFLVLCVLGTLVGLVTLAVLLVDTWSTGQRFLTWDFLTSTPSRIAERAGFFPAIVGSLWLIGLTGLFSFPLGVAAALYL
jgi:phosphate transport system permease protein